LRKLRRGGKKRPGEEGTRNSIDIQFPGSRQKLKRGTLVLANQGTMGGKKSERGGIRANVSGREVLKGQLNGATTTRHTFCPGPRKGRKKKKKKITSEWQARNNGKVNRSGERGVEK